MKPVLSFMRLGMFLALGACANHPLDCAMGFYHSDCLAGTKAYEAVQGAQIADDQTCQSYGLKFGTAEYAQCRQNAANQREANRRAAAAAYIATRPQPAPSMQPYQGTMNNSVTTNCIPMGNSVSCTSY